MAKAVVATDQQDRSGAQQGLRQVKEEQRAHLQTNLERVEASMQPASAVS